MDQICFSNESKRKLFCQQSFHSFSLRVRKVPGLALTGLNTTTINNLPQATLKGAYLYRPPIAVLLLGQSMVLKPNDRKSCLRICVPLEKDYYKTAQILALKPARQTSDRNPEA